MARLLLPCLLVLLVLLVAWEASSPPSRHPPLDAGIAGDQSPTQRYPLLRGRGRNTDQHGVTKGSSAQESEERKRLLEEIAQILQEMDRRPWHVSVATVVFPENWPKDVDGAASDDGEAPGPTISGAPPR